MERHHARPALGATWILGRKVAAIPVVSDLFGKPEFGTLGFLPAEAVIAVCGRGINDDTARVCWNEQYYIVFLRDLGVVPQSLGNDPKAH